MANVTEMPPTEAVDAESKPPSISTSASKGTKNKTGRPRKGEEPDPETRARQFFDRAAQIPSEDWGNRAWMYLYIDEPVCDEKQWGKMKYAKKLHQPIFDLEKVKDWYGSCKGWISLNLRKPDAQNTDQIGRHEFEIFDIHCPPKIPKACWTDDPVNKKWAALLPPEPKAPTEGATSLLDSIKVYKEIRDEVRDEREDPETPLDQTRSTLETMKLAKELFGQPAPAPTAPAQDPLQIAVKLAETMMQMKADNPVIDMYRDELKALRDELKEERAQARNVAPTAQKSFLDQALELANNSDKLEPLKKLATAFGFGGGEPTVRAGKTTGMDILNNLVSGPAGAALAQGLGTVLMNLPSMFQPNPANNQPHPPPVVMPQVEGPPQTESPEHRIQRIGEMWTRPLIAEFFMKGEPGEAFAANMWNVAPEDFQFLKSLGAENLISRYRRFPQAWNAVSYREADFITFIQEVCAWTPEGEEPTAPPNDRDGIVDLEAEGEIAGAKS
jgi:hypothetical protein